jgi:hypothetical protein
MDLSKILKKYFDDEESEELETFLQKDLLDSIDKKFIDQKVNKKLYKPYVKMIDEIEMSNDDIIPKKCQLGHFSKFYQIEKKKIFIGYIQTVESSDDAIHLYLYLDLTKKCFLFVGATGLHPFVVTDKFTYDNSDGSCPFFVMTKPEDTNAQIILLKMEKFTKEFCHDWFH